MSAQSEILDTQEQKKKAERKARHEVESGVRKGWQQQNRDAEYKALNMVTIKAHLQRLDKSIWLVLKYY